MTRAQRAQAAYARAEIEKDPRIKAAWRTAAATWERIDVEREAGRMLLAV